MELSLAKSKQISRKPMRLKDYLLDELSSCSSNGFRSYPRRPCCTTTVRLLVELDLKKNPPNNYLKKPFQKKPSKSSSISALQKASNALINAMKHLPFASAASKKLSKNLLKRCFGKKCDNLKIQMQKPVGYISQGNYSSIISESNIESYSWLSSDFTASDKSLGFSSATSEQVKVQSKNLNGDMTLTNGESLSKDEMVTEKTVGGDDSTETTAGSDTSNSKKPWRNEEEKEQFSPVSVLDCPFEDDEDEVSSPFQRRISRAEGNNKKVIKKIKGLERLRKLEPINLEKRIALSESANHDSKDSPLSNSSQFSLVESMDSKMEEDNTQVEANALWLLQLMRGTMSTSTRIKSNVEDKLLLDFFKEGILNSMDRTMDLTRDVVHDTELMNIANDWLKGQPCQVLHEKEVEKNMEACLRDMEREGKWKKKDEEIKEVALELEVEVFASLVNEVLDDYVYCSQS